MTMKTSSDLGRPVRLFLGDQRLDLLDCLDDVRACPLHHFDGQCRLAVQACITFGVLVGPANFRDVPEMDDTFTNSLDGHIENIGRAFEYTRYLDRKPPFIRL